MPRAERRTQILQVATDVFARQGYHATSMDMIAMEAGVSKPVLYQHFESKHELFSTVMDQAVEDLANRLSSILSTVDTRAERVYESFRGYFQFVTENRTAFIIMSRNSSELNDSRVKWNRALDKYVDIIAESIRERNNLDRTQAYIMGRAITGMAEQAAQVCLDNEELDIEEVTRLTAQLAFEGLAGIATSKFSLIANDVEGENS